MHTIKSSVVLPTTVIVLDLEVFNSRTAGKLLSIYSD